MNVSSYKSRTLALATIIIALLLVYAIIPSTKFVLVGLILMVFDFWKNAPKKNKKIVIFLSIMILMSILLEFISFFPSQLYLEIVLILVSVIVILNYVFGQKFA